MALELLSQEGVLPLKMARKLPRKPQLV